MKRLRLPLSLALLCVLVAMSSPAPVSAATPAKRMVQGINWWRGAAGLSPLHYSRKLRRSSKRRARVMMRHDFFAHGRLRVPSFERVGEVLELHGGRRARVARTIRRWSRSSGHRHVLLSPGLRRVGAGRATGRYRGHRATIWVVRLGTK